MRAIQKAVLRIGLSILIVLPNGNVRAEEVAVDAPSVVLVESTTGQVIYAKNENEVLPPASVTKIMTLLLIFEALDSGEILLTDEVVTSENAASMGGSQVFLEQGEVQTVDTMIRCIAVASANDASVAMAEHIAGTEEEFVKKMNEKANDLGMENTVFKNCNGLDAEGHATTAYDIALMSRELMNNHPVIEEYTTIWMENITHTTSSGTSEFGLTNTNKLVRNYPYTTGLKTGSTSQAKFCISATASKDGVGLIAVIMAASDSTSRNNDAIALFNYGFANCQVYKDEEEQFFEEVSVSRGVDPYASGEIKEVFRYVDVTGADINNIERSVKYNDLEAPIEKGDVLGTATYELEGEKIGEVDIVAREDIEKMKYRHSLLNAIESYLL